MNWHTQSFRLECYGREARAITRLITLSVVWLFLASSAAGQDEIPLIGDWYSTSISEDGKTEEDKGRYRISFSEQGFETNISGMQLAKGLYRRTKTDDHDRIEFSILANTESDADERRVEMLIGAIHLTDEELTLGFNNKKPESPPDDLSGKSKDIVVFTFRRKVRGEDNDGRRTRPDDAVRFDADLTDEFEKRIDKEIDLFAKRIKEKLSEAELKALEDRIDRLIKSLREWSVDRTFRWDDGESIGSYFVTDRRHRKQGSDLTAPPVHVGGVAGRKSGVKLKGVNTRYEIGFDWSSSEGEFTKEWSEEDPLDEEYRVHMTGALRLYLLVETTVNGKLMRAEGETKTKIFDRHEVVLKASEGKLVNPASASDTGGKSRAGSRLPSSPMPFASEFAP